MELEKKAILNEKAVVEQEKIGLSEDLIRVEQQKMDIDAEKSGELLLLFMNCYERLLTCLDVESKNLTKRRVLFLNTLKQYERF